MYFFITTFVTLYLLTNFFIFCFCSDTQAFILLIGGENGEWKWQDFDSNYHTLESTDFWGTMGDSSSQRVAALDRSVNGFVILTKPEGSSYFKKLPVLCVGGRVNLVLHYKYRNCL